MRAKARIPVSLVSYAGFWPGLHFLVYWSFYKLHCIICVLWPGPANSDGVKKLFFKGLSFHSEAGIFSHHGKKNGRHQIFKIFLLQHGIYQKQAVGAILSERKGTRSLNKLGPMMSLEWWWAVTSYILWQNSYQSIIAIWWHHLAQKPCTGELQLQ